MENSIILSEKEHLEVGFYQEAEKLDHPRRKTTLEKQSLQKIYDEVEVDLQNKKEWSRKVSVNFANPFQPTFHELLTKNKQTLKEIMTLEKDLEIYYKDQRVRPLLNKLFLVLRGLTLQFELLSDILDSNGTPEELELIKAKDKQLEPLQFNILDSSQVCIRVLRHCLDYLLLHLLYDLHKAIQHLFKMKGELSDANKASEIQIMTGKIRVVSEYLPVAANFNQADIFALDDDHPYLIELKKVVQVKSLGPPEKINKSFNKFIRSIQVGVSTLSKGSEQGNGFARRLTVSFGAMYYFLWSAEAQMQTNLFYSEPKKEIAFSTWNTLEDQLVASMMKIVLPSITFAKTIYINRMFEPLTLDIIRASLEMGTLNSGSFLEYRMRGRLRTEDVTTLTNNNPSSPSSRSYDVKINGENKVPILVLNHKNLVIKNSTEIKVNVKDGEDQKRATEVISERHIGKRGQNDILLQGEEKKDKSVFCGLFDICKHLGCFGGDEDGETDRILIHIHGGGFVSMSANSHQSYTRQWAKKLKHPVLSIDYRLAPEHPYPAAIDDCWQAYNWILNHAEETLGIKPKKIVLTGDSAGGNLAIGVAILAIKCGIKVPDGLFLAYPALNCDPNSFSPSLMLALDDQLVPYTLLKLCIQAYVPVDASPTKDPLISPILMSDELLKKLPPVRIVVGDRDPLHDECWRFTDKLRNLGKDVSLTVYENMCHGFLGYDVPMGMPECAVCIQDAAAMIKELFDRDS